MSPAQILSIVLDLVLIGLVAAGVVVGIVRGFLKSVMKPVRVAASLAISALLSKPISKVLVAPIIQNPLENKIQSYVLDFIEKNKDNPNKEFPTLIKFAAALKGVDLTNKDTISDLIGNVTGPVAEIIALAITFGILFLVFVLVIRVGCWLLESFIKDTTLGKANKIAGAVFNALLGLVVGWAFVSVFDIVVHMGIFESGWIGTEFNGGILYRLLLNFSPIELLLSF